MATHDSAPLLGGVRGGAVHGQNGWRNPRCGGALTTEARPAMSARNEEFFDRRTFFKTTFSATGLAALNFEAWAAKPLTRSQVGLIDVNVHLSRWPFRRVRCDETADLAGKLRAHGVTQAWAGTFDGLLHKDLSAANVRLADECAKHGRGLLKPFGSVNPMLPDWEEELRRCADEHRMMGIRLHPNYHGYKLDHPELARLLKLASERRLVVQLALVMEDERMMHPMLQVAPVDTKPLADVVRRTPGLRLVLLNALRTLRGQALSELLASGQVYVEIAMLEGVGGVERLLQQAPMERVLFGSHAPLFYLESASLKLKESNLTEKSLRSIRHENALRLLEGGS